MVFKEYHLSDKSILAAVTSCVKAFNWTPHYCKSLFLDGSDFFGLFYWHVTAVEMEKNITENSLKNV